MRALTLLIPMSELRCLFAIALPGVEIPKPTRSVVEVARGLVGSPLGRVVTLGRDGMLLVLRMVLLGVGKAEAGEEEAVEVELGRLVVFNVGTAGVD